MSTMSTIILTHGTSENKAKNIMQYGFGYNKETVWSCSDDSMTYFYQVDKLAEAEGCDDFDFETQIDMTIQRSNENAQITAALESSPKNSTIVFEVMIEYNEENKDSILEEIMEDLSCEGMADIGAVCVNDGVLMDWIRNGIAKVTAHVFDFCPKISLMYLAGIKDSDYLQDKFINFSNAEMEMMEALANAKIYIDEIFNSEEIDTYEVKF